jgi:hypothetical protein
MKALTRQQLQARKEGAVRFMRDVSSESERASKIEGEGLGGLREAVQNSPQQSERKEALWQRCKSK